MAWGERAVSEAKESIESLRRFDQDIPVMVLGDQNTAVFLQDDNCEVKVLALDPYRSSPTYKGPGDKVEFVHARVFAELYDASPWDRTLYLDVDTEFMAPPGEVLDWLDRWDFAIAETPTRALNAYRGDRREFRWTAYWLGDANILYHNAGLFAWRAREEVRGLFRLWMEEWARFENWDSQVALLRALARSEVQFLTLPWTWNSPDREEAHFVYHRYGTQAAWKEPWSNLNESMPDQSCD